MTYTQQVYTTDSRKVISRLNRFTKTSKPLASNTKFIAQQYRLNTALAHKLSSAPPVGVSLNKQPPHNPQEKWLLLLLQVLKILSQRIRSRPLVFRRSLLMSMLTPRSRQNPTLPPLLPLTTSPGTVVHHLQHQVIVFLHGLRRRHARVQGARLHGAAQGGPGARQPLHPPARARSCSDQGRPHSCGEAPPS